MTRLIALALILTASACTYVNPPPPPPENINLHRHYTMIDANGNPVGTVTFRPVGTGEIRDRQGQLIGIIGNP